MMTTKPTQKRSTGRQSSLLSFLKKANGSEATKTSSSRSGSNTNNDHVPSHQTRQESVASPTSCVTPDNQETAESTTTATMEMNMEPAMHVINDLQSTVASPLQVESHAGSLFVPAHGNDNNNNKKNIDIDNGLSDYELLRLRNIERNNARLAALGLLKPTESVTKKSSKPSTNRKRPVSRPPETILPVRRSTRRQRTESIQQHLPNMGMHTTTTYEILTHVEHDSPAVELEEQVYTVSPLEQHVMTPLSDSDIFEEGGDFQSLSPLQTRLAPPSRLGAIYSLQFYQDTPWIVGAGKAGVIALWDSSAKSQNDDNNNSLDPILCWKAHSGRWIAEARFVGPPKQHHPSRLLTAANDGTVCLWDLTTVSAKDAVPKQIMQSGKELHTSGIFALDVQSSFGPELTFATASKDKTIRISTLGGANKMGWWTSHHHSAKVGDVRFRGSGSSLLASVADDGLVVMHDVNSNRIVAESSHAHARPHSIVWNPLHEYHFMTAGHDKTIKLWDIRRFGNQSNPLATLEGHVPVAETKCKKIHRPTFYNPSPHVNLVLTGGQNSHSLSTFHCQGFQSAEASSSLDVSLTCRAKLPLDCGDAGCIAVDKTRVAVATDQAEVLLLRPCQAPTNHNDASIVLL